MELSTKEEPNYINIYFMPGIIGPRWRKMPKNMLEGARPAKSTMI